MTANAPMTANITIRPQALSLKRVYLPLPERRLLRPLLVFRWLSLLPALGLWLTPHPATLISPSLLLLVAVGSALLLTTFTYSLKSSLTELTVMVVFDTAVALSLLLLGGYTASPFYWYALNPLLLLALLVQPRGVVLGAAVFTLLYLAGLAILVYGFAVSLDFTLLLTQLVGFWSLPLLLGYLVTLLKQVSQGQQSLTAAHARQTQQLAELTTAYQQLQIIHDLTVLLQGAADLTAVQQRILRMVTQEMGFNRAVIGRVHPVTPSLGDWQVYPTGDSLLDNLPSLSLTAENGLLVRKVLESQTHWWHNEEPLLADEDLNIWLAQNDWLILPLTLPEGPVGVLLLAVNGGPASLTEDQLVVLSAVAGQAAVALGAMGRTRRLAAEQERNRIARDIHDTIAQSLFGIVFSLDACIKMLPSQVEAVQQELLELRQVADHVRQDVRRSILDTWPSELTTEQFKADLDKYVAYCSPAHAFKVEFTLNGDFDRLPAAIRRTLYRISQEALANAARYAGVDSARLTMHVEPDQIFLSISDHGRGFDTHLALAREYNREHFGLRGMCERVQALGGTCDILSQVGQGAQILVRLPINGRSHHD